MDMIFLYPNLVIYSDSDESLWKLNLEYVEAIGCDPQEWLLQRGYATLNEFGGFDVDVKYFQKLDISDDAFSCASGQRFFLKSGEGITQNLLSAMPEDFDPQIPEWLKAQVKKEVDKWNEFFPRLTVVERHYIEWDPSKKGGASHETVTIKVAIDPETGKEYARIAPLSFDKEIRRVEVAAWHEFQHKNNPLIAQWIEEWL